MKIKAIVFDLFGTIVPSFTPEFYEASLEKIAECLGAEWSVFRQVWHEIAPARNSGEYPTSAAVIDDLCEKLGIDADDRQRQAAVKARWDFSRDTMIPRTDALDVLTRVRESSRKIALISNCSPITEEYWPETPFPPYFDVTVFSSSAGCRKPDIRIYRQALDGLEVEPDACLYVGDGDGNELTGALEAGMHPVMISVPTEDNIRLDTGRQEWDGPVIHSLSEILRVIEKETTA